MVKIYSSNKFINILSIEFDSQISQISIRKIYFIFFFWRQITQIASSNNNRILIANIYTMHFVYYGHLHAEPCTQSYESYIL